MRIPKVTGNCAHYDYTFCCSLTNGNKLEISDGEILFYPFNEFS